MKTFALRYVGYSHVISNEEPKQQEHPDVDLRSIDTDAVNPEIIRNFLCQALPEEVESFVSNYFHLIGEDALKSQMFRQYILLNAYFALFHLCKVLASIEQSFRKKYRIFRRKFQAVPGRCGRIW